QPPLSTRESTSRPRKSPPRGNCPDGLANVSVTSALGECGETTGPMTATPTTKTAIVRPAAPRGVRAADQSTVSQGWRPACAAAGGATGGMTGAVPVIVTSGSCAAAWPG